MIFADPSGAPLYGGRSMRYVGGRNNFGEASGPAMRSNAVASMSLARVRRMALIGTGWLIIGIGIIVFPLPGPGGLPIMLVGGIILLRNSDDAKRLFVRMKRRYPKTFLPVERLRLHFRRRRAARR